MQDFKYVSLPSRVIFKAGAVKDIADEVKALGAERAIVLCTPEQVSMAHQVAQYLGERCAGIYPKAVMHVPVEVAREAREYASSVAADCAVAIGGGSTVGLGKAIALESALPIIAIPTTYAGSEMTPIYGITEQGLKKTGRSAQVLPKTVIYDPELSTGLPVPMSIVSGFNAIAHAAEGLYAQDGNPVMSLMAEEGIRALSGGMKAIFSRHDDALGRTDCLYGAWLCGAVLGHVGMSIHHKLCHTLGGSFNLPHAETHTIVLPHALAYNRNAVPDAMYRIARAMGREDAPEGLFDLARELGAPVALKSIGMREEDLDRACDIAMSNAYWNPRPLERTALRQLLQDAWEGQRPSR
jgi:maleylacetate reductase